ncbi:SGT1 protein-domain-containing protein [Podospora conica]|nr:SGT1 protein-domain-containing protein [Schizothecium conicum]
MDQAGELRPGDDLFDGFRMTPAEDCVEYMLFVPGEKTLGTLETIRKAAVAKADALTKDYIWQRDAFNLETKIDHGLSYLHGTTSYGDNVEDEWLIVYLLRELTKTFPQLWVRVFDTDGEFLLIEAAKVLPNWLNPENDTNRVWIHQGNLLLIPLDAGPASKSLPLKDALAVLASTPDALLSSPPIQAEAFSRLDKYPNQIPASLHHALATIPRKLAYILHARPKAIAPATEAFYLRDPLSLRPLLRPAPDLVFPPRDLVTVSVRFTKVLYAQLKSQRFDPPPAWLPLLQSALDDEAALIRLELGLKLTTGFELLARRADTHANRAAREVALLLDDLAEDGDDALPSDGEIKAWKDVDREDDDAWMEIDFRDFEQKLEGKSRGDAQDVSGGGFGDAQAEANLERMVSRFEAFLNDESAGLEGAEVDEMDRDDDDDDDEDDSDDDYSDVSFDEEQYARMMRDMMGLPPLEDEQKDKGKGKATTKDDDTSEEEGEDEEIRKLMGQMESELNALGALQLDPSKPAALEAGGSKGKGAVTEVDEDDDDGEVDIDYNLAKNLLESFKSQGGLAGPAGNLMSLMGMTMPRDEADSDDDDGKA